MKQTGTLGRSVSERRQTTVILVVEDDRRLWPVFRELLPAEGFEAALVGTAREALDVARRRAPPLAVVDLGLPDLDGVELLPLLKQAQPSLRALVVSALATRERVLAALRAGADGYLLKEDLGRWLVPAIHDVLEGAAPFSPVTAALVLAQLRGEGPGELAPSGGLSAREHQTLEQLARGLTYEQAAACLGLSLNTVRTHVRALYEKLGVSSRTEAVMTAVRLGLLRL